jgi:hypothetical protein
MIKERYIGKVVISSALNAKSGECWFYIGSENFTRVVENKCLYDALSDYGIGYEKAKEIVKECAKSFDSKNRFDLYTTDLYKPLGNSTKPAKRNNNE